MSDTSPLCATCPPAHADQPTQGRLCDPCANGLLRCLRHIETCYQALSAMPLRARAERGTPGYGSRSPARDTVIYEQDRRTTPELDSEQPGALAVMDGWVQMVLAERRTDPPTDNTLPALCGFLRQHHAWLLHQPWIDDYTTELDHTRRRLQALIGLNPDPPAGQCLGVDCQGQVYPLPDVSGVRCATCGRTYRGDDLARLSVFNEQAAS